MLGAIIGDIVGSRFEWNNCRKKDFEFLSEKCFFTDDSVMSLAVCKAILECRADFGDLSEKAVFYMQKIGRHYPDAGYGGNFFNWIFSDTPSPYNSFGNGAAMRVSACGFAASSLKEAQKLSLLVTKVSHDHPEGLKGASAVAESIFLLRSGKKIEEVKNYVNENFYKTDFTLDEIRGEYKFNETCQGTVPQAFEAFFESADFEDAVRNAVSVGGDSDTLAAITGSLAESHYGIVQKLREHAISFLDGRLCKILFEFEKKFPPHVL